MVQRCIAAQSESSTTTSSITLSTVVTNTGARGVEQTRRHGHVRVR